MKNLATLQSLVKGVKVIDKKGSIGSIVEDEKELFFEFENSNFLVRVTSKEIYSRQIKILKKPDNERAEI